MSGCAERPAGPPRGPGREGGFLLLEALIGLAIIGIVGVALLAATGAQVRSAGKASVLLVAGALAQDRLTAIQLLDFEGLGDPPDSLLSGAFPPPFEEFTWQAEVTEADGEYDLFAVRLEVHGLGEVYPLETLLHRSQSTTTAGPAGGAGGRGGAGGDGGGRGGGGRAGPGRGGDGGGGAARGGGAGGRGRGGGRGGPPGGGEP
jgi:type II secretory pathway pseudopilin PulG